MQAVLLEEAETQAVEKVRVPPSPQPPAPSRRPRYARAQDGHLSVTGKRPVACAHGCTPGSARPAEPRALPPIQTPRISVPRNKHASFIESQIKAGILLNLRPCPRTVPLISSPLRRPHRPPVLRVSVRRVFEAHSSRAASAAVSQRRLKPLKPCRFPPPAAGRRARRAAGPLRRRRRCARAARGCGGSTGARTRAGQVSPRRPGRRSGRRGPIEAQTTQS